jgi:hypothetical protein
MSSETKKFKWDDKALIPDAMEITFPAEVTGGDAVTVKQWELGRSELVDFVVEAMDKQFVDDEGKRIPFKDVATDQEGLFWKFMSKSSRGVKDEQFYQNLMLGAGGLIALVDAFLQLNHLDEIMASGGNWFMLPTIRQMLLEAENVNSESPKATMEA